MFIDFKQFQKKKTMNDNNAFAGWHRGFSELLGANHPSIWKLI